MTYEISVFAMCVSHVACGRIEEPLINPLFMESVFYHSVCSGATEDQYIIFSLCAQNVSGGKM